MKTIRLLIFSAFWSVLALTAAGCRTHSYSPDTNLGNPPQAAYASYRTPPPPMPYAPEPAGIRIPGNDPIPPNPYGAHAGWGEDRQSLKRETIYFDFDKAAIKSGAHARLDDVAHYLRGNAAAAIRVEGNCDERGTEEYNRALGERRALASREYLIRLGIQPGRIDTLSNGEDRPAERGHQEAAWSKNRRDEFVVLTAPNIL